MIILYASASSPEVLIPTIGGIGATLLGVLVGAIATGRSQRRHWAIQTQTEACSELLRESTRVFTELASANLEGRRKTNRALIDWDAWNQAMNVLDLTTERSIVRAAHELDRTLSVMHTKVGRGELTAEGQWRNASGDVERARLELVNVARKVLDVRGPPLTQLHGKPRSG